MAFGGSRVNSRCLLIGLDGATFSILDPLMEDGAMPFLKQFVESGTRAELHSVIPPLTPPAWASIMTGRSPGNHGVFDFVTFESPDSRYVRFSSSSHLRCETIWSMVSRQGLSATALNFPLMAPTRPISGCVVPGWVPWRHLRRYCYPNSLYQHLQALPAFNVKQLAIDLDMEQKALDGCPPEEQVEWVRSHLQRERQWFEILAYLMRTKPHHLTAVVFDGVDKLQHLFWRLLDPACPPRGRSPWEEEVRKLCLDYFRQLDGIIAEIVALAGDAANVFMVSDHGFGPSQEIFYVNNWLSQNGYLTWTGNGPENQDTSTELGLSLGMLGSLDSMIDWARTTAYARTPYSYGIHICVGGRRGREGIDEAEYPVFRKRLMDALGRFSDPKSKELIVTDVWTREEAFPGTLTDLAPDLTFWLRDGGVPSTVKSDALLRHRAEPVGSHRSKGIFLARGPAVAKRARLPQVSVLDVTPILLYALGLPIPEDLEGQVRREMFESSFVRTHPIVTGEPTHAPEPFPSPAADGEGEEEVVTRLKALGYLD